MNTSLMLRVLPALFVALFILERLFPLRNRAAALLQRLVLNLTLAALAFVTAAALVKPLSGLALRWSLGASFGLLHLFPLPPALEFALGFLLLDLSFYYWHVANHKIPLLWRFHNVHHIDPELDVSTGFRFHFGEVLFSTLFRVAQVSLIGMSFATFAAYEVVFQTNTLFHHSNLRLP